MQGMIRVLYKPKEKDSPPFRFKVWEENGSKKVVNGIPLGKGMFEYYIPDNAANRQLLLTSSDIFMSDIKGNLPAADKPGPKPGGGQGQAKGPDKPGPKPGGGAAGGG